VFSGITVDENGTTGTLSGTINGNTIGTAVTCTPNALTCGNTGSQGDDINLNAEGSADETLAITNNNLYQYSNASGIAMSTSSGSPTVNLTITGNTIADPGAFGTWGIDGTLGGLSGDAGTTCVAISGNTLTGSAPAVQGGAGFEIDQSFGAAVDVAGMAAGSQTTSAVVNFIASKNTDTDSNNGIATESSTTGNGGFFGATSCPTPP
jgi:hypothetical protein